MHGAAFQSVCWPQQEATQYSFKANTTKLGEAGITPSCRSPHPPFLTDATTTLQESPAAAANMQGGFLHTVRTARWDCMRLGFSSNCTRGKLREPLDAFGPGNPASSGLPMPQADGKPVSSLQVQKQQARTLQILSRHLTSSCGLYALTDCMC